MLFSTAVELPAETIVLCAGVGPNPVLAGVALEKCKGRILVEPTMRVQAHPEVWALGDCAWIPDVNGQPYPQLAQHALRQARALAENLINVAGNRPPKPFVYTSLGTLGALGHYSGIGRIGRIGVRGFAAWWIWRTYYLFRMPGWKRRFRIILDWTVALFFHNDIVKLDLLPTALLESPPSGPNRSAGQAPDSLIK